MNKDNKYYQPKIEEFHVGFEFEILINSSWHKLIFGVDKIKHLELEQFSDDLMKIAHAITQVKILDREDIESIGFIYNYRFNKDLGDTEQHSCNMFQAILKDVPFCNSSRDIDLKITYLGKDYNPNVYRLEMYERNYFEWYPIFEGNIKNKSELKILLKQLEII